MTHQQWEYKTVEQQGIWSYKFDGQKYNSLDDYLNSQGKDGWELVQGPTYQNNFCIFKRPKQ